MSSLSKDVEVEVQSFIELMFASFKRFRRSRDEIEPTLESKQGLGHVKETNNSQDCYIQTTVQDQPTKSSFARIGARIGTFDVDKLYQENFKKYLYYH
jgi:tRNA G10  N-methylase Trm11